MLKTIKDKASVWARGSRPLVEPDGQIFPPPDIEHIRKRLNIENRAKSEGKNNIPVSNSTQRSAVEIETETELSKIHNDWGLSYQKHCGVYQERYNDCTRLWEMELIENEERKLVEDVVAEAKNQAGPVFSRQEDLIGASEELLQFRRDNKLTKRLPKFENTAKLFFIVMTALIVEFATSFILMREGGDRGTLVVIILLFCVLNTVFPLLFFSRLAKYLFGYQFWKKLWGLLSFTFIISFGFFINFLVGHYRAAAMSMETGAASDLSAALGQFAQQGELANTAYLTLVENPFNLPDVWSWLLISLNLIIYFISLSEGIIKDDWYPGYGRLARDFREKEDEYNDEIEGAQEELADLRETAIEEIKGLKTILMGTFSQAPVLRERTQALYAQYCQRVGTLPAIYSQLVMRYRQENVANRSEEAPEYFDEQPVINLDYIMQHEITEIEPETEPLVARVETYAKKVNEEFDVIVKKIKGADIILGKKYPLRVTE
jgi:hypothetical protein